MKSLWSDDIAKARKFADEVADQAERMANDAVRKAERTVIVVVGFAFIIGAIMGAAITCLIR